MTDNKSRMKEKVGPNSVSFRYKEPLKHEMELGGRLSGHVQVYAPGQAESLQDRRPIDQEVELLPGFQLGSSKDQDDPIWSDKNVDTQRSSNCSNNLKVSVRTYY